jgi:hypothetical protein
MPAAPGTDAELALEERDVRVLVRHRLGDGLRRKLLGDVEVNRVGLEAVEQRGRRSVGEAVEHRRSDERVRVERRGVEAEEARGAGVRARPRIAGDQTAGVLGERDSQVDRAENFEDLREGGRKRHEGNQSRTEEQGTAGTHRSASTSAVDKLRVASPGPLSIREIADGPGTAQLLAADSQ